MELFKYCVLSHQLTKKNHAFVWTIEADKAYTQLKEAFTSAPILAHIDPEKPFTIETDASDFAFGVSYHNQVRLGNPIQSRN